MSPTTAGHHSTARLGSRDRLIATRPEDERVFLIGLQTGRMSEPEARASLRELRRLAESTVGSRIVGESLARLRSPEPATFLSAGLVDRLGGEMAQARAGTVILDEDVSPAQQNNLSDRWGVKVLTRSELILDIFARRAHTSEGKLQVELAQLQYRLPRLRGLGVRLSRLGGGIGTRGPGEKMLETDRRALIAQVRSLERWLRQIKRRRETQRARREANALPVIALVGYTNAGKSTLLNALTGAGVDVKDKLFATLDTTTRRVRLPSGMSALLTDTVGFINRLPTELVSAFRATLEEVVHADLLVHLVDAASPARRRELEVTRRVLKELGAGEIPTLTVWNKIDALDDDGAGARLLEVGEPGSLAISALRGAGLDRLLAEIDRRLLEARPLVWLRFDHNEYGEALRLEQAFGARERRHDASGLYLKVALPAELLAHHRARRVDPPPRLDRRRARS